jgi:hypothetical protein
LSLIFFTLNGKTQRECAQYVGYLSSGFAYQLAPITPTLAPSRARRALPDGLLIFVSRLFRHGEKLEIPPNPKILQKSFLIHLERDQNELMTDQEDLTMIQKIENQEIHENSRKY